jgi:hypothetical protein
MTIYEQINDVVRVTVDDIRGSTAGGYAVSVFDKDEDKLVGVKYFDFENEALAYMTMCLR